jgi:hypothetical protein
MMKTSFNKLRMGADLQKGPGLEEQPGITTIRRPGGVSYRVQDTPTPAGRGGLAAQKQTSDAELEAMIAKLTPEERVMLLMKGALRRPMHAPF